MNEDEYLEKSVEFAKGTIELAFRMGYVTKEEEIVRCRDCKWFDRTEMWSTDGTTTTETICSMLWSNTAGDELQVTGNDYCSFAERKEE